MSSVTAANWQSSGPALQSPPRLLAACVLASVVVHAVLLLVLPGWWHPAEPVVPAVIDVVLVPADLPALPAPPALQQRAPAAPPATNPAPRATVAPTLQPEPARVAITAPAAWAETALPAAAEFLRSAPGPSSSASPAAARAESALTPPAFNAAYLRNPPPRYPPAARRSGDEGTVLLRVLVTAEGAAARVELDRSSGSASLDSAALEAVRNWRFIPARRGTLNVEDWVRVPVVFRLES